MTHLKAESVNNLNITVATVLINASYKFTPLNYLKNWIGG